MLLHQTQTDHQLIRQRASPHQMSEASRGAIAWHAVYMGSCVISLLLFTAALFKLDGLRLDLAIFGPRVQDIGVIGITAWELLLAVALVRYRSWDGTWLAATITFACFLLYSLRLAFLGKTSCGCFGRMDVDPHFIAIIDLFVLILTLNVWRRLRRTSCNSRYSTFVKVTSFGIPGAVALVATVVLYAGLNLAVYSQRIQAVPGMIWIGRTNVLWEPDRWIGHALPIRSRPLNGTKEIDLQNCALIVIRQSCTHCQDYLDELRSEYVVQGSGFGHKCQLFVVDLDPPDHNGHRLLASRENAQFPVVMRLESPANVFADVPCVVTCTDGIVTGVAHPTKG